jgi:restriction endonuclease S subunit
VRDTQTLLPQFLAWQINQAPAQRYMRKNAEGTDQLSIRRGVLEELPIALPSVSQQSSLIDLDKTIRQERALHERLIRNREQQIEAMALELLAPE